MGRKSSMINFYVPLCFLYPQEGVLFDAAILFSVLKRTCPAAYKHMQRQGVEPLMFATDWLMCLYSRHLPFNTLLRVWDLFFCNGEGWLWYRFDCFSESNTCVTDICASCRCTCAVSGGRGLSATVLRGGSATERVWGPDGNSGETAVSSGACPTWTSWRLYSRGEEFGWGSQTGITILTDA